MHEPLPPADARRRIRDIVINGVTTPIAHALVEMEKDRLSLGDCRNVLRGGVVEPAEFLEGAWRYRVKTARVFVVVEFASEMELIIVTAWRLK